MVVNLEYIKAIVTAEEVLLLDPLRQEVLPFVDQLRHQLSHKTNSSISGNRQLALRDMESNLSASGRWIPAPETSEGLQAELPFEFQVLEIALEVVCTYLDSSVADLERDAYPVLDELAKNVSTKNLERVRSLKSNLTRLLARVQKVLATNPLFLFFFSIFYKRCFSMYVYIYADLETENWKLLWFGLRVMTKMGVCFDKGIYFKGNLNKILTHLPSCSIWIIFFVLFLPGH